jgi:hypothetical protein
MTMTFAAKSSMAINGAMDAGVQQPNSPIAINDEAVGRLGTGSVETIVFRPVSRSSEDESIKRRMALPLILAERVCLDQDQVRSRRHGLSSPEN